MRPQPLGRDLRERLDTLYRSHNDRSLAHPDPVEFLYRYEDPLDREVVGLVASALAYGRVTQIHKSIEVVLARMARPRTFLLGTPPEGIRRAFLGFRHRFTSGADLAGLLLGVRDALERHGSLEACFLSGWDRRHATVLAALEGFVSNLTRRGGAGALFLLPPPSRGSACKRLNLFLRWMVRRDEVDPGAWSRIPPSRLVVPLDTHMYRFALRRGFTHRRSADLRTALEVTSAFRAICPEDPVRYDFALTRLGMTGRRLEEVA